jgi:hypothetical protein
MAGSRVTERLNRLAGGGGGGGGLPLPHLFSVILEELLDNGGATTARITEIAQEAMRFKTETVLMTWPSFDALAADVLAQMEDRQVVLQDGDAWRLGPAFRIREFTEIIPPRKGSRRDGTTVWPRDEREARSRASFLEHEDNAAEYAIAALARDLEPGRPGIRPVDEDHAARIRESVPDVGQLYPVLEDQHGRILDGKHRRAADPGWYPRKVTVRDDAHAVAIARWANSGTPLPPAVERRIEESVLGAKTAQERQRERIRQALLDNPELSHNKIAKQVGVTHRTVDVVCAEVATGSNFSCTHGRTGQGARTDRKQASLKTESAARDEKVADLLIRNPRQSNAQIMSAAGLSPNQHRVVERIRDALAASGQIPQFTEREGSDGQIRRLPQQPPASPAPARPAPAPAPVFSSAPDPVPQQQPVVHQPPVPEPAPHQHAPARWITYCSCGLPLDDVILEQS